MKKFFLLLFLPVVTFSAQNDFDTIKADIAYELNTINGTLNNIRSTCSYAQSNLADEYAVWQYYAANDPNNNNGYQTALSAAQSMYNISYYNFQSIENDITGVQNSIARSQQLLASIPTPTNSTDLSAVIYAIESNTYHITHYIATNTAIVADWLDLIDDDLTNILVSVNSRLDTSISNLQAILAAIQSISGGSGGGSDSSDVDLSTLESLLTDVLTQVSGFRNDVFPFYSWTMSQQSPFRKFFDLANERLQNIDVGFSTDLQQMWVYTVQNAASVISNANDYPLHTQLAHVHIDGTNERLSNEGYIALQNLAMNERQYLCSIEALKKLDSLSSTNNLSWITNYLATVQKPYYELFNQTWHHLNADGYNPFYSDNYNQITNFWGLASSGRGSNLNFNWIVYKHANSNWFNRVEQQLMMLNGYFPVPTPLDTEAFEHENDKQTVAEYIADSTNSFLSVVSGLSSLSNNFNSVLGEFKRLTDSFEIPEGGMDGYFRVLPSFELGDIQFEHIDISWNDLDVYVDAARTAFTAIWYTIFALLSFKFIVMGLFLFGKMITHTVLMIGTFLS